MAVEPASSQPLAHQLNVCFLPETAVELELGPTRPSSLDTRSSPPFVVESSCLYWPSDFSYVRLWEAFLGKLERQGMGEGTSDHIIDTEPQSRSTRTCLYWYLSHLSLYVESTP